MQRARLQTQRAVDMSTRRKRTTDETKRTRTTTAKRRRRKRKWTRRSGFVWETFAGESNEEGQTTRPRMALMTMMRLLIFWQLRRMRMTQRRMRMRMMLRTAAAREAGASPTRAAQSDPH